MREWSSTMTSKGQVTIPKAVRERLGIGPGDKIVFVMDGDTVRITRWESIVQRTAGIARSDVSFATAEEMRAAAEEEIAADAYRRMSR